ncbi:conserved hypothetical protein [Chlorobium limicola DSM 245]|uniref:MACPF-like domain-containing protein n=1 Tax=Chlorobium limicola (strain DSM 245 / NBRC 103803 / 6330) TaxID=290315 RepID=B3EDT0_CHLL2|nr:MAC/perforin domain-containing protein [Chlorobium limicola]ACD89160.1 conserved hypothetical protein [Chlorobium limicola DSM 245]
MPYAKKHRRNFSLGSQGCGVTFRRIVNDRKARNRIFRYVGGTFPGSATTGKPASGSPATGAPATGTPSSGTPASGTGTAPAASALQTTAVAWLSKNQAAGYIQRFQDAGYDDLSDLLPEIIRTVLQGEKPGVVDRLVRIRTQELRQPQPLPAPALKPGMEMDLSAPVLKGMDGISIKLPDLGFAPGPDTRGDVVSPASMTNEDWLALAINSDMLMGLDLESFFEGESSTPQECFAPALWWKVPASREFFNCEHLSAKINTEITYTSKSATMVSAGFTSVTASVSTPRVSASVSHEKSYRNAQSSKISTLYIVGMYDLDRVRVDLDECTVVSPRFVAAVENALADPNPKDALAKVFQKYGQIIGRQITLGGRLFFVHVKEEMENSRIETLKSTTSAAIAGAYGAFGGSGSVSFGSSSEKQESSQSMNEKIAFQAIGGDVTLANEPEKWKDTIKSPAMWEVIRYDKIRYTYELLSPELRELVLMYWERPMGTDEGPIVLPKTKVDTMKSSDGVSITGFKIHFGQKFPGLSMRYYATSEDGSLYDWVNEGKLCGTESNGASPLQDFLVELTGGLARRYELHYRAMRADDTFTEWVSGTKICGSKGMKIKDIQAVLSPVGGGIVRIPAESFIPSEGKGTYDIGKHGTGIVNAAVPGEWVLTYQCQYTGSKPVRRRLEALFASANESRPVKVEFNGAIVNGAALEYGTGAWDTSGLRTARIGTVTLLPGMNTLKISRPGPWSPHMKEFRLVAEVIDIPATSFIGTSSIGKNSYGLGVIDTGTCGGRNSISAQYEFSFTGKKPTTLMLEGVYAAGDSRPVDIVINPEDEKPQTFSKVMATVTGSWWKDWQRVETIGDVTVRPGKNTLMLRTTVNTLPHIQEFRLVSKEPFFDFDPDAD